MDRQAGAGGKWQRRLASLAKHERDAADVRRRSCAYQGFRRCTPPAGGKGTDVLHAKMSENRPESKRVETS